ncbi:MAG: hypothetical protein K0Q50_1805 [Vampirovibrio sp.]|jgi:hypothetical protein|nr:hypothetical protein [Vampirovibrio sp.]
MSSKKLPVSINVFPTLDCVELIQFDERSGDIEKASSLPCQFDPVSRQMGDRDLMVQTVRDLYNMNRIPFNTPAVLVLPSFFTREIELPTEFSRDELRFALVSEAERFYVFKKAEPQIDWINLDESRLLYAAFPKAEIEKYMKIFQELKIPLLGIELGYFSMLRGLVATGAVAAEIENASRWCMLTVSDNSFFASVQDGVKIIRTTEAPLSVTEDDDQSTIQEIQQDFETFAEQEIFSKLVVVNNSNRINSDDLMIQLSHAGSVILIEQNARTLKSRGSTDGQFPCSLEGIGGVFYRQFPEMSDLNFLLETGEDVAGIMYYKKEAIKWLLISNGAVFLLCLMVLGVLSLLTWQKDQEREALGRKASELGASINAEQLNDVNRKKFIKKVVDQNVKVNNFLVKLGSLAPKDVWLDKVQLDSEKLEQPLQIQVEGKALTLDEVNTLITPLNANLQKGDLEVSNAAQATSPDGQAYFTWSIQNKAATDAMGSAAQAGTTPSPMMPPGAPGGGH